ncbi:MAG: hypothetical protein MUE74_14160, partial [Bacteroidales bacterium]|nr:hypothetical protein [Bacteroidales bacterium]
MKGYIIGKILIGMIILTPVFFLDSCDKQEKCGCDGDLLFTMPTRVMNHSEIFVSSEGSSMSFMLGYDTYFFCNPVEMYEEYKKISSKDQIKISGDIFWDCNYVTQASQSSY